MKLFNSLTHQLEEFVPFKDKEVGMYTCGPTVYSFVTVGNWRTYFLGDLLVRALTYFGFNVNYIMNITDVGHLTGDNLGDASTGEDRLEKAAVKENKTAWDIAKMYTDDFFWGFKQLGFVKPEKFTKATDHIEEQIGMIKVIEEKGYTYKTSDGVYFDVGKYETAGHIYGQLSNIDEVKAGARVEINPEKKDPRDFALWKYSYQNGRDFDPKQDAASSRRQMEWSSPWGVGFPGWHIECSAMSTKYLGCQFDLHIGGEDLRSTHHPNEIVQSEVATGCVPFVKYWVHGAFLKIDGGRMGKSLGNAYTLRDLEDKGYKPEHLKYFYLTGHYRQPLNFTWENLESAKRAYEKLTDHVREWSQGVKSDYQSQFASKKALELHKKFEEKISNDLEMPQALAVMWEMVKSDLSSQDKLSLLLKWDYILGFNLGQYTGGSPKYEYMGTNSHTLIESEIEIPAELVKLIDDRQTAKHHKNYEQADKLREALRLQGYVVEDRQEKVVVKAV